MSDVMLYSIGGFLFVFFVLWPLLNVIFNWLDKHDD